MDKIREIGTEEQSEIIKTPGPVVRLLSTATAFAVYSSARIGREQGVSAVGQLHKAKSEYIAARMQDASRQIAVPNAPAALTR